MSGAYPLVPLGELVRQRKVFIEISDGENYKRCRAQLHARGVVLRDVVDGADIKTKRQQVCRSGDLLVAEIDAKVGGYGIVPPELAGAMVSSHYFLFDVITSRLDVRFLGYFLRTASFHDQVVPKGSTNYAAIRASDVLSYRIPLPPLDEQRRIVGRIEEVVGKIAAARDLRRESTAHAQALAPSILNALVEDELRGRWPIRSLGDIADIRAGVTLGRRLTGQTVCLPYLRVANVQDGHLDLSYIKEVEVSPAEAGRWRLEPGDLLMTEGGDWDKLGRCAVWSGEISDCIHQNHIFRVRANPDCFLPPFLAMLSSSPYGKSYFQSAAKRTTNLATINQKQLRAFQVFCPPLEEQRCIMKRLDDGRTGIGVLKQLQEQTASELDALLPAVLERAFSGAL